jgi:hypothetical protein
MDGLPEVAAASVALLVSYLQIAGSKAAESLGEKLGDGSVGKLRAFYDWMRGRVADEPDGQASLDILESNPSSETRQAVVADVVARIAEADDEFATELQERVADVQSDPDLAFVRITDVGIVALGGDVKIRGRHVSGRDMYIRGEG